jgi:hypothetical protein
MDKQSNAKISGESEVNGGWMYTLYKEWFMNVCILILHLQPRKHINVVKEVYTQPMFKAKMTTSLQDTQM